MSKEIVIEIKTIGIIFLLIVLLIFFSMELQLSISSHIVFGDEGTHAALGKYIGVEKEFPIWNPNANTNLEKYGYTIPPFWHLLQGSFYMIFGFNDIIVKALVHFISLMIGITSYVLVKKVYNEVVAIISSLILVTLPSFVTYSVLVYTDILLVFYFTIVWFTSILFLKTDNKKYLTLSVVFASFAYLTKNTGFFAFGFIVMMFFYKFLM